MLSSNHYQNVYVFYTDPGHGWLEVPVAHVKEAGVLDSITRLSYQSWDGALLYLEEDCDAPTFLAALKSRGVEYAVREARPANDRIWIRSLPHL